MAETTTPPGGGAEGGNRTRWPKTFKSIKQGQPKHNVWGDRAILANAVDIVKPTDAHIAELAANMRQQDIDELRALGHDDLAQPIRDGVKTSTWCYTALIDGRVACIFGVAPFGTLLDSRGAPWALGTDLMWPNRRALARMARGYIAAMLREFPHLVNIVHAKNTAATAWLARCGFVLQPPQPTGPHGELFHIFEMRSARV